MIESMGVQLRTAADAQVKLQEERDALSKEIESITNDDEVKKSLESLKNQANNLLVFFINRDIKSGGKRTRRRRKSKKARKARKSKKARKSRR